MYCNVCVPHVRVGDAEIDIDGHELSVYCKPYLLKLHLPGRVLDDEHCSATYDPDEGGGTLKISVVKETPGEVFQDLDLTTRLLAPPPTFPTPHHQYTNLSPQDGEGGEGGSSGVDSLTRALASTLTLDVGLDTRRKQPPRIEVLSSEEYAEGCVQDSGEVTTATAATPNNSVPSNPKSDSAPAVPGMTLKAAPSNPLLYPGVESEGAAAPATVLGVGWGYGFNRSVKGMFEGGLRGELACGLLQLSDPEGTAPHTRGILRREAEARDWDGRRYAGDFIDGGEEVASYLSMTDALHGNGGGGGGEEWAWKEEEVAALATLPRKELMLDGEVVSVATALAGENGAAAAAAGGSVALHLEGRPETIRAFAGLATLLFAYAYDFRQTGGEGTVESSWTVTTLSPLLSWLDDDFGGGAAAAVGVGGSSTPTQAAFAAALSACMVRSLTYPYLRRWDLGVRCGEDAVRMLEGGRRPVLRALLAIRASLGSGGDTSEGSSGEDHKYLLNTLYLNDLCVWLQLVSTRDLQAAALGAREAWKGLCGEGAKSLPAFSHMALPKLEALALEGGFLEEEDGEEEEEEENGEEGEETEEEEVVEENR